MGIVLKIAVSIKQVAVATPYSIAATTNSRSNLVTWLNLKCRVAT